MYVFLQKALRLCSTTLEATVTNTAANFMFTVSAPLTPQYKKKS